MRSRIEHFGCKECGGTLGMREGNRVVTCGYCGVKNLALIEGHVPRYVVRPLIGLNAAKRKARDIISEPGLASDLPTKSFFYDAGLYYLPLYEMTGMRVGKMTQTDVKAVDIGGAKKYVEKSRASVLMADLYISSPAVKLGDWGVEHIPLEKQRQTCPLEPFCPEELEKDAVVFEPNIPPEAFDDKRSKYEGTLPGDETRVVTKSLHIVYSPVWLVKYTYHNRLYRFVIDAVSGETLHGRAPAGDSDRVWLMLLLLFLIVHPISRIIRSFITEGFNAPAWYTGAVLFWIPALIGLSILLTALANAWNQFRYSGEVVWRGERREIERVNKPPETKMERYARMVSDAVIGGLNAAYKAKVKANKWYGLTYSR